MPTFIKTGFWERNDKSLKGWLNLDLLIQSLSPGISSLLTGFTSTTGTITSSDTIISGIEKLDGNKMDKLITIETPDLSATSNYTLVLADNNKLKLLDKATAITLTVPTNTSVALPIGTQLLFAQYGVGQVTITPEDGSVTILSSNGLKTNTQYSQVSLIKIDTNIWLAGGDLIV